MRRLFLMLFARRYLGKPLMVTTPDGTRTGKVLAAGLVGVTLGETDGDQCAIPLGSVTFLSAGTSLDAAYRRAEERIAARQANDQPAPALSPDEITAALAEIDRGLAAERMFTEGPAS